MEASDNQIQANQELPFEEAMQKLSEMSDKTDSAQVYRIFSALKSHVRATPAYADRLVKRILASKERDPSTRRQMSAMFGALAQSKNPAIADTLSQLASECPDNYCKVQAIVGLNDHVKPTEASAAKMIDLAASTPDQEVAATALLAAGSIGHKIDAQLPELPKTLIKIYGEPGKEGIKTSVLAAMGNHGNSEYLPVLEAGLKDKEPVTRAASVYSLRNIPSPSVNESIVNVIEKDESKSVVREALKAVAYRTMTADEYMKIAVKSASFDNQELQEDAARVMVDAYKANPGPLEAAIRTFHDKASFPNVKVYIETQSKPAEATAP
jgi:HEAT repeat protein